MARTNTADPNLQQGRRILRDFPGYMPNLDPHDLEDGATIRQVNAMSLRPGEMRVRPGFVVLWFTED